MATKEIKKINFNYNKRIKIAIFLIGVIISLCILVLLSLVQDNFFIGLIKSFYKEIASLNSNESPQDKIEIFIPMVQNYRRFNIYIYLIVGGLGILFSGLFSIFLSDFLIKKKNNTTTKQNNDYLLPAIDNILDHYLNNNYNLEIDYNDINNNEVVNKLIKLGINIKNDKPENNEASKIINMNESLNEYKKKIRNLEKEKEELSAAFEDEKEKNEILFSEIERITEDSHKSFNDNHLEFSNEEYKIEKLLDEILRDNKITSFTEYEEKKEKARIEPNNEEKSKKDNIQNELDENLNIANFKIVNQDNNKKSKKNNHKIRNEVLTELYEKIRKLCKDKKYDEALNVCENNLSENEKRKTKFAFLLGYIYSKLNKNRLAKKYLIIVLSANPTHIDARNLFGVIQYRMGEKKDAEQHFNMVLIQDSNNKVAKENLKRIKQIKENNNENLNKIA